MNKAIVSLNKLISSFKSVVSITVIFNLHSFELTFKIGYSSGHTVSLMQVFIRVSLSL